MFNLKRKCFCLLIAVAHLLSNVVEHIHQLDLNLITVLLNRNWIYLQLVVIKLHLVIQHCILCSTKGVWLNEKGSQAVNKREIDKKANRGLQLLQCFCLSRRDDTFAWNCVGAPQCQFSLKVCGSGIECCVRKCQTQIHKLKMRWSSWQGCCTVCLP